MAKVRSSAECVICGEVKPLTREHVPPKNLFLSPRPTNTITVRLCESCNHGYHLDDEYFRVYVTAGARPGTPLWSLWKEKVVGSSFLRGGGLKGRLNADHSDLVKHFEPGMLKTFEDHDIPAALLAFVQPFEPKRINAVVEKIVIALRSHHGLPRLQPDQELHIDVAPLDAATLGGVMSNRRGEVGHKNEFVYFYDQTGTDETWILLFYELHAFTVTVRVADQ